MYLKIKIQQTPFNCALQSLKIDLDIAIEKTHSQVNRIHWVIWQLFMNFDYCEKKYLLQSLLRSMFGLDVFMVF
jgi:hypothetical protein